ncbi:MAG TPA: YceI family protein [Pseudomonadales bacterium]|jgi:polyisoprenoid-binding protein YceI
MRYMLLVVGLMLPMMAMADWVVDGDQSSVYYTSIKNNSVAENNRFKKVSGQVTLQGSLDIKIDLGSVDTAITIRDERVRALLFNVAKFPVARIQGEVNSQLLSGHGYQQAELPFVLSMHGLEARYTAKVNVWHVNEKTLLVSSREAVLVNATDFNLQDGLDALKGLAGLQSIAPVVPVGFTVLLRLKAD